MKQKIDVWTKIFRDSYLYYYRNKILFPEDLKDSLDEYFEELRKIRITLLEQKESVTEEEEYSSYYYDSLEDEIPRIHEILKMLKDKPETKNLFQKSLMIMTNIESVFKKLLK